LKDPCTWSWASCVQLTSHSVSIKSILIVCHVLDLQISHFPWFFTNSNSVYMWLLCQSSGYSFIPPPPPPEWQGSKSWGIVQLICPGHVTNVVSPWAVRQLHAKCIAVKVKCWHKDSAGTVDQLIFNLGAKWRWLKLHAPAVLPTGKNPGTHWIGGWVGPFVEEF
jgi:hypothetical protein